MEKRLIDANAFKEYLWKCIEENADIIPKRRVDVVFYIMYGIIHNINEQPTVDAVPVVRCKDCKWWENWNIHNGSCERLNKLDIIEGGWFGADADDFCSFAERRDDETDRR